MGERLGTLWPVDGLEKREASQHLRSHLSLPVEEVKADGQVVFKRQRGQGCIGTEVCGHKGDAVLILTVAFSQFVVENGADFAAAQIHVMLQEAQCGCAIIGENQGLVV